MKIECVETDRKGCKNRRKVNGIVYCALPHAPSWGYRKGKIGFNFNVKICFEDRSPEEIDALIKYIEVK